MYIKSQLLFKITNVGRFEKNTEKIPFATGAMPKQASGGTAGGGADTASSSGRMVRRERTGDSDEELEKEGGALSIILESQESEGSLGSVGVLRQQSSTGLSQDFNFLFSASQDDMRVPGLAVDSELSKSIGVVCLASRETTHKKQKAIKPHAIQKTFYAYAKNCEESKRLINEQIEEDMADFKVQNYTVEIYTFGLPFEVEATCNITRGYKNTPKIFKAETNKRKSSEKSDSEDEEDKDYQAAGAATKEEAVPRRILRRKKAKKEDGSD